MCMSGEDFGETVRIYRTSKASQAVSFLEERSSVSIYRKRALMLEANSVGPILLPGTCMLNSNIIN